VDVVAFERLAVPTLAVLAQVVVIDELGKMELASAALREAARVSTPTPPPAHPGGVNHEQSAARPDGSLAPRPSTTRDSV